MEGSQQSSVLYSLLGKARVVLDGMFTPHLARNVAMRGHGSSFQTSRNFKDSNSHDTDCGTRNTSVSLPEGRITPPSSGRRPYLLIKERTA
jgi:hypothetical protein